MTQQPPKQPANGSEKSTDGMMSKPGRKGFARLIAATRYSWRGFKAAWLNEEAFRIEASLALAFIPMAFVLGQNIAHQIALIITCGLVILAEVINTAIESIVDRIGPEHDPLSGQAKDLGSAAVFVTLSLFSFVWLMSTWHYFRGG
ncbi:diacylglycerol kinase [Halioglobus sp. HI00S01]|uniref:diacylglycerol kinase n=1 Tax=Halioglobus sp. HI00S01 TaxID=1822214 RepID=UPI000B024E3C|nr:diacylglycerol kinase [Halioglobus sp. HI00S01]